MATSQFSSFALIFSFVVVFLAAFCSSEVNGNGFTVDMLHRDSPASPLYRQSENRYERLAASFRRSINRARRFNPALSVSDDSAEATVTANSGEYLVKISLGSPPFPISAIVDTGSDLIWTQCQPCENCYKQIAPIFDPRKSRTYKTVSCQSAVCSEVGRSSCDGASSCSYSVSYGDHSYTNGVIAVDTVTLGSTTAGAVAFPKTIIGCGFDNQGTFREEGSGIVGLGRGPESLVSQMGSSINGKFSYCLIPINSKYEISKLHFGDRAIVAGGSAFSTPLLTGEQQPSFYFLNLEAISVGTKRIDYTDSPFGSSDGNIIIDSGTTLTLVPQSFYSELESAVADQIELKRSESPVQGLSLCYETHTDDINVPEITVHFDGANVELKQINTFVRVSEDLVCFAFAGADDIAIYGNIAQMNFLVGYDSVENTVTFKPTDCSEST